MADQILSTMIDAQTNGVDPFAKAKVLSTNTQASMMGDPFSQGQSPMQQVQGQAPQASQVNPNQTLSQLYQPQGPQQGMDQKLMSAIQKLDIKPDGLQINAMGKMLLGQRLQQRWGSDYKTKAGVSDVLGQFDNALNMYSDEAQKSMNNFLNTTNRTLAALRG